MNREAALKLRVTAVRVADVYSGDREFNTGGERFCLAENGIIPLSDDLAAVVYDKSSGKQAIALFFHVRMDGGRWNHFFPTDSHLLGFREFDRLGLKQRVELLNYPVNFVEQTVVKKHGI